MEIKRESTHLTYWQDCIKYGKVEKPCDLNRDCKIVLGIDTSFKAESFDELWSSLEKQSLKKYKKDVVENCAFNYELEEQQEIKYNFGRPSALNSIYINYEDEFILPVEPLYADIEKPLGTYKREYYCPKFCGIFYACVFDTKEGLQIFKASNDFYKDTEKGREYGENKSNRVSAKLTSYDRIRDIFKAPYSNTLSPSDRWLMEKTVGFNMALKIYERLRTHDLSEYLKNIIKIIIDCNPVHIRAQIAGDIFTYLDQEIGYDEDKCFLEELRTVIADINKEYQLLYWLTVDKIGLEKVYKDIETTFWENLRILEAHTNEFVTRRSRKKMDFLYEEEEYIRSPMDKDVARSDYRAFAMIEREIIGQSYNHYFK